MKKRIIASVLIMLVTVLVFTLVACSTVNYDGTATVNIMLDREYGDVEVSCPSGEIVQKSATEYQVSLPSLAPVEIVVSCAGYESVMLAYTFEQLKENQNISEQVSLTERLYRFRFTIDYDGSVKPTLALRDNIDGVSVNEIDFDVYELQSKKPIVEDVVLTAGDEYKDIVIFSEMIAYPQGTDGRLQADIRLLHNNADTALIYCSGEGYNVNLYDMYTGEYYNLSNDGFTEIELSDYALVDHNRGTELLRESDLVSGYYYYSAGNSNYNGYTVEYEVINAGRYNLEWWQYNPVDGYLSDNFLQKSGGDFYVGDKFVYTSGWGTERQYYLHEVTAKEAGDREIDLSGDRKITADTFAGRQIYLDLVDVNGNSIDYNELKVYTDIYSDDYVEYTYAKGEPIPYDYSLIGMRIVSLPGQIYTYEQIGDFNELMLSHFIFGTGDTLTIEIDKVYDIIIKYIDGDGKIIDEKPLSLRDGSELYFSEPSGYEVVGETSRYYFYEILGDRLTVKVDRVYEIEVQINNIEQYRQYIVNDFISSDNELYLDRYYVQQGKLSLRINERYVGKTVQFIMNDSYNGKQLQIEMSFSKTLADGDTVYADITDVDDEW